jgi:Cdc6-like AAA superfamily ATPase
MAILEPKSTTSDDSVEAMKPIIFILDEFDLFALRDTRQSLLYCLLDIVQSGRRAGGMAIVGLSARGDCINKLEKRLKSRCQSRMQLIPQPATLEEYTNVALSCLKVDPISLLAHFEDKHDRKAAKQLCEDWNKAGAGSLMKRKDIKSAVEELFMLGANRADLLSKVVSFG